MASIWADLDIFFWFLLVWHQKKMVDGTGFEPVTSCVSSKRSEPTELTVLKINVQSFPLSDAMKNDFSPDVSRSRFFLLQPRCQLYRIFSLPART